MRSEVMVSFCIRSDCPEPSVTWFCCHGDCCLVEQSEAAGWNNRDRKRLLMMVKYHVVIVSLCVYVCRSECVCVCVCVALSVCVCVCVATGRCLSWSVYLQTTACM